MADDLRRYFAVAAEHAPETAVRWLNRFEEALQTLSTNPKRDYSDVVPLVKHCHLGLVPKSVSIFAPRKHASFAERKATVIDAPILGYVPELRRLVPAY